MAWSVQRWTEQEHQLQARVEQLRQEVGQRSGRAPAHRSCLSGGEQGTAGSRSCSPAGEISSGPRRNDQTPAPAQDRLAASTTSVQRLTQQLEERDQLLATLRAQVQRCMRGCQAFGWLTVRHPLFPGPRSTSWRRRPCWSARRHSNTRSPCATANSPWPSAV